MTVSRPLKLLLTAGLLLVLALVIVVAGYALAPNFYLTRTIFWRESDYKDLEKFPARTIHNSPPLFRFDKVPADNLYASRIEAIASDNSNGSLEHYLDASGTTAFLVIHDDKVLYERYFNGYDETSVNTSFSMAKSFASALVRRGAPIMNRLDWTQIALSLGVMLVGLYIALFRHPGRGVLATTRVASFGVALIGLSYFAGGFEGSAVEGPLLDRVEAYSALVGILVVLGALVWQARGRE